MSCRWVAALIVLCVGCGARSALDTNASRGAAGSAHGTEVTPDARWEPDAGCPDGLPGPALIEVKTPSGISYCIDATEVTNAEYRRFLSEEHPLRAQPPECQWNTRLEPATQPLWGSGPCPVFGKADPRHPVLCVDWCDAWMYCRWAQKRLCGRVGGGPLPMADFDDLATFADANLSQWFNACSAGGTRIYPGGDLVGSLGDCWFDYRPRSEQSAAPVGVCEGGAPGVFDLVGNAIEHIDSCVTRDGPADLCRAAGAAYAHPWDLFGECAEPFAGRRDTAWKGSGFRCCLD